MDRKIGEEFRPLPTDSKQELSMSDMQLLKDMFPSASKSKKKVEAEAYKSDSDSDSQATDSDSDSDDEDEPVKRVAPTQKNLMDELKLTFIASLIFVLLSNSIVDNAIKSMGMDGFKLVFIKLFMFAVIFFVVRYNFS